MHVENYFSPLSAHLSSSGQRVLQRDTENRPAFPRTTHPIPTTYLNEHPLTHTPPLSLPHPLTPLLHAVLPPAVPFPYAWPMFVHSQITIQIPFLSRHPILTPKPISASSLQHHNTTRNTEKLWLITTASPIFATTFGF